MKKILPIITIIAIVGGGAFYCGMKYQQSKMPTMVDFQNLRNLSPGERQQPGTTNGQRNGGSGFVAGEIIAKDDNSITVKLQDGGSKIIFYSESTEIGKSEKGSLSDLEIGENVTINGTVNSDGSISSRSIQIR